MSLKRDIPWSEVITVANKHVDYFRFMVDTKQWVRVIQRGGEGYPEEIYMELHPADMHSPNADWDGIRNALVKTTKQFGANGYYHHCLPKNVVDNMNLHLGDRLTNILMNFDFIPRNKRERNLLQYLPVLASKSVLFTSGVPLVYLGGNLLANKDHSLMLDNLSTYYATYNKRAEKIEVTEEQSTGFAYAFKQALAKA